MNKKYYIKPNSTMVQLMEASLLDTHVSGTDLPGTGMGGDTDDSNITPESKDNIWWSDDNNTSL